MIPKRATFYWDSSSGPMSWLRLQSLETFKALNPSWIVEIISGSELPIVGTDRLAQVHRSDWMRYLDLHRHGGVYFDTDIIFTRPFDDAWLDSQILLVLGEGQSVEHVAVLGCVAGEKWFEKLAEACSECWRNKVCLGYQELGILIVKEFLADTIGKKISWLSPKIVTPVRYWMTQDLWSGKGQLSPLDLGVHWYGGDWLSIRMEAAADEEWARNSDSLVARAWRKAMTGAFAASAETLAEQHGLG